MMEHLTGKESWEMTTEELIAVGKHGGYVRENVYTNLAGEEIKFGEYIEMSMAGRPVDMPQPWKLIRAENYFSTVGYDNQVRLIVEATNGKQMVFDVAKYYSPHPVSKTKEPWQMTKEEFKNYYDNHPDMDFGIASMEEMLRDVGRHDKYWAARKYLIREALSEYKPVPERVLKDYYFKKERDGTFDER